MIRTLKVMVGGDDAVGKTSPIRQYAKARFSGARNITLGIGVTTREFGIDGQAGNRPNFFPGAQAALLIYDTTIDGSLQALTGWHARCKRNCRDAPSIVVGNKVDLGLWFLSEWPRTIAWYARGKHGFLSAKTGENVRQGIELLARSAMKHAGVLETSA